MFTGIVEELGTVQAIVSNSVGARLHIQANDTLEGIAIGDSLSVCGCCLTVVTLDKGCWSADVVPETLSRTCLGALNPGDQVNLERAMRLSDRLGGHMVQGHVDGVGTIKSKDPLPDGSTLVSVKAPRSLLPYVVEKGSIAVDGVSLTVAGVDQDSFSFAMIPHTAKVTTLGTKESGAPVNLEVDMLAKYIEKLVAPRKET